VFNILFVSYAFRTIIVLQSCASILVTMRGSWLLIMTARGCLFQVIVIISVIDTLGLLLSVIFFSSMIDPGIVLNCI